MTLKTSLIITGDASVAKKEVADLAAAVTKAGETARTAAAPIAQLDQAQTAAASSAKQLAAANDDVAKSGSTASQQLAGVNAAQTKAATGAAVHAAAASNLGDHIRAMLSDVAGGATVFDAMGTHGDAFAAALASVAQESAKTGASGTKASVDLGGLGDTVLDVAGKTDGMGGKLGSVAAILGGPWGAAIGIGINLLGGFVAGLIEGAAETEKLSTESLTLVDALGKQKVGTDAAREAIKAFNEQQEQQRKTTELATRQALANAEAALKVASATREATRAKLEDALANEQAGKQAALDQQRYGRGEAATIAYQGASGRAAAIERSLKDQETRIAELGQIDIQRSQIIAAAR